MDCVRWWDCLTLIIGYLTDVLLLLNEVIVQLTSDFIQR